MAWQTPKTNWAPPDGVRDADLNRIEGNILELYKGGSGMSDTTMYVSDTGSDTTGTGASANPYRTIMHALGTLPKNLNGKNVLIYIATGVYNEDVVVKGFNNGMVTLIGYYGNTATINSLEVNSAICEVRSLGLRLVSNGITVTNGAVLLCTGSVTVVASERGLYVNNCSSCRMYSQLDISNASAYAVQITGASMAYILSLAGSGNEVAILAEEGSIAAYGATNISTTVASYVTRSGGRILTGSGGI